MVHCCLCIALPLLQSRFFFSAYTQWSISRSHRTWSEPGTVRIKQTRVSRRTDTVSWDESDNHSLQNPLSSCRCTACTWFQVIDNKDCNKIGWCVIQKALYLDLTWIKVANRMWNYNLEECRIQMECNSKKFHIQP